MIIDKCQDKIFLFLRIHQMTICFIIPDNWFDVIDVEIDCRKLSVSPSVIKNEVSLTPKLVLQGKSTKERRDKYEIIFSI